MERAAADIDGVPAEHATILEALEVGETVTTAALYARMGDRLAESSTREARMARLRRAMAAAVRAGMARDVTDRSSRPYDDFLKIQCVAEWINMLNAPNTIHTKSRWGGTRSRRASRSAWRTRRRKRWCRRRRRWRRPGARSGRASCCCRPCSTSWTPTE